MQAAISLSLSETIASGLPLVTRRAMAVGVNAIAHSCYDPRTVGKKDEVSFVVTHIDEERNVAVGLITRIIRQNL